MISRKTTKLLSEFHRLTSLLFDPDSTMPMRRRVALERKASRLLATIRDDLDIVKEQARAASKTAMKNE